MSMAEERVIKIGMLGLGTVGTGVYKVLKSQQEEMLPKLGARVELKKILVRNVEKAAAKLMIRRSLPRTLRTLPMTRRLRLLLRLWVENSRL